MLTARYPTQAWDIYQGGHLFTGSDPELNTYRSRAHLAEMIALLGPPPSSLLSKAKLSHKFFSDLGDSSYITPPPSGLAFLKAAVALD